MATYLKTMRHTEYQEQCKSKSEYELKFIIADCKETIELQKDFNPNCEYYADCILYCEQELVRRSPLWQEIVKRAILNN